MPQIFPEIFPQNLVTMALNFIESILLYTFGNQFVVDCIFKFMGIGAILGIISLAAMIFTYGERRVCAFMQKRIGPNRVGPYGLLQSMADTLKLMTKEDIIPFGCDRVVWALSPMLLFVPSALIYAFYSFDDGVALADVNIGLFLLLAISSQAVLPFLMGGYASNSKYALIGGMRTVAQMISYEAPMAFSAWRCYDYRFDEYW